MNRLLLTGCVFGLMCAQACKGEAPPTGTATSSPRADLVVARSEGDPPALRDVLEDPNLCLTMRTVEESDVLRVEDGAAYYARSDTGLSIFDLGDLDAPKLVASSAFTGTPVSVFVKNGLAYVVFVDWSSSSARSIVRALDVRRPERPVLLGEAELTGLARDARLVSGVVYVLVDDAVSDVDPRKTVLASFAVRGGALRRIDQLKLSGGPGVLAMNPYSTAVLRASSDGSSTMTVTRVDIAPTGELARRGTLVVPGALPAWEQSERGRADLDDGGRLVVVACAKEGCSPSDPSTLVISDMSDPDRPRLLSRSKLAMTGGTPPARFVGHVFLYGATTPRDPEPTTDLVALRLTEAGLPYETGRVTVRGAATTIVPRTLERAVVIGSAGPHRHSQIVIHDVSVRENGSLGVSASVALGRDWTWTLAHDTDRAVSLDPSRPFLAIPFTSFTELDRRYQTGAEVVEFGSTGIDRTRSLPSKDWIERLVFVNGRLVAFGTGGVEVIEYGDPTPAWRHDQRSAHIQ